MPCPSGQTKSPGSDLAGLVKLKGLYRQARTTPTAKRPVVVVVVVVERFMVCVGTPILNFRRSFVKSGLCGFSWQG